LLFIQRNIDNCVDLGIFLEFEANQKRYVIYNLKIDNVNVSLNVIFYENNFPKTKDSDDEYMSPPSLPIIFDLYDDTIVNDVNTDNNDISQNFDDLDTFYNINSLTLRRTTKTRQLPTYLKVYHVAFADSNTRTR